MERVFGVIKHLWGLCKVRYRSLGDNGGNCHTPVALAEFLHRPPKAGAPKVGTHAGTVQGRLRPE
ncbi:MAG: hypothetical protein ACYYK0_05310 [Candidatus Eutrophobiaceae bacterium]